MNHITLSELNQIIKRTLGTGLEPSYWVVAEIGEIRTTQKGHCYLELIEKVDEDIISKLRANIWSTTFRNLSTWFETMTGQSLQKGMKILANAVVQYHEVYGLSLMIRDIDPNFTLGEREKKRREIIDRLIEDGIFDMNRELNLTTVPQNLAVISSPTAAGLGDFMSQLEQNPAGYRFNVRLYKAVMQGVGANESIVQALHQVFDRIEDYDALVLIRGGGSQVDLDCFDSYDLASHIAQFPLPVITGIGHERDETIVDLVAHTKLKTPTAVSEFLINALRDFEEEMNSTMQRLNSVVCNRVSTGNLVLENALQRLVLLFQGRINLADHQLDAASTRIAAGISRVLTQNETKLGSIQEKLKAYSFMVLNNQKNKLDYLEHSLHLMDPREVLKKGYSITLINDKPVNRVDKVKKNDTLKTRTLNWEITGTVDSASKRENG